MIKSSISICSLMAALVACLVVSFARLQAEEISTPHDGDMPTQTEPDLSTFLNLSLVDNAIKELAKHIELRCKQENLKIEDSTEKAGSIMSIALTELHKFRRYMTEEQARHVERYQRHKINEIKRMMEAERAKAGSSDRKKGDILGGLAKSFMDSLFNRETNDKIIKSDSINEMSNEHEVEDEKMRQTRTYAEYLKHIRKYNQQLEDLHLGLIRKNTHKLVETLFDHEARELANLLFQQYVNKDPVAFKQGMDILLKAQKKLFVYLRSVLLDTLAIVSKQIVLPEKTHSSNWMMEYMID